LKTNLGILSSRIRVEEKLLIKEARNRSDIKLSVVDPRKIIWDLSDFDDLDVLIDREISQSRAYHVMEMLDSGPVKLINDFDTVKICGDKVLTSLLLEREGVPTPDFRVAFDKQSALVAVENIGYPAVLKPVDGSWGRMVVKINDRESAEAILEHKSYLDSRYHSVYYIQKFVETGNKDIRAFLIGDDVVGAAYRKSDHWVTNAARGGKSRPYQVKKDLIDILAKTNQAVGGGVLAVDLLESSHGLVVNEINPCMEFKESMKVIDGNIPARVIDYAVQQVKIQKEVERLNV